MRNSLVMIACALAVCVVGALAQQNGARQATKAAGQTYASLSTLPDWSGAWRAYRYLGGATTSDPDEPNENPPFKDPAASARFREAMRIQTTRDDNQARQFAQAAAGRGGRGGAAPAAPAGGGGGRGGFNGTQSLIPINYMEFLFTPGRVTIVKDNGQVRRIYTDGTVADPTFISAMGTSTGHWEGNTLVVDTIGLDPKTMIISGSARAGEGFKVHERMFLKQKDVMEFDTTIEAPEALTMPYHMRPQLYQHDAFKVELLQPYVGEAAARDRSVDPVTHSQTFDLTPPADLPPPPPRK